MSLAGDTPLHYAMKNGCREIVQEYCNNISPLIFTRNADGHNALNYAIMKGHRHLAIMLIEKLISIADNVDDSQMTKSMIMSSLGEDFHHVEHVFQPTYLDDISTIPHIFRRIFDNLEPNDLKCLGETNMQWNFNLNDPYYWLKRCRFQDMDIDFDKLGNALRSKYYEKDFRQYKDEMSKILKILQNRHASNVVGMDPMNEGYEFKPPELIEIVAKHGLNLAGE